VVVLVLLRGDNYCAATEPLTLLLRGGESWCCH